MGTQGSPRARFVIDPPPSAELLAEIEAIPGVWARRGAILVPDNAIWIVDHLLESRQARFQKFPGSTSPLARNARPALFWLHPMVIEPGFLTSYQREGVARALTWPNESGLFVWSAGSGKTLAGILWALSAGPAVSIVVTKAAIRPSWDRQIREYTRGVELRSLIGESPDPAALASFDPTRPVICITGYDTLPAWIGALERLRPVRVVFDECFPAGTPILTLRGQVPIENVGEGDLVLSRSSTGVWVWRVAHPIVTGSKSPLVRIHHEHGSFVCTATHRVWTEEKGMVDAHDLGNGDLHLRLVWEGMHGAGKERDDAGPRDPSAGDWASLGVPNRRSIFLPGPVPPEVLQGGLGVPRSEVGDRSGRELAQNQEVEVLGQAQGVCFARARVVRVEVLERGSGAESDRVCCGDRLYDLDVDETHNYVAGGVLVSNCHRAKSHQRWDAEQSWEDEGKVKFSLKENQAAACLRLSKAARHRLGLTATPIRDRVRDLWAQLDLVRPGDFGGFWNFARRYCAARENPFGGMDTRGSSNLAELQRRLGFVVHSVPHSLANRSLPPARRLVTFIPISQQVRAEGSRNLIRGALKRGAAGLREALLMEAASRKRKIILDHVLDAIDGKLKIVIFTGRKIDVESIRAAISKKAPGCPLWAATGEDTPEQREVWRLAYMAAPGPAVLVATGESFGEGLDLQDTDLGIMAMLPYTPGQVIQYEGRWVRLGMKRPVEIRYFVAEGTIDEHVSAILLAKLPAIERTVDLDEVRGLTSELAGDESELIASMAAKVLAG